MNLNALSQRRWKFLRQLDPAKDLTGERFLITVGATREEIDPVRFISNRSSGRMGYRACRSGAADVVVK